MNWPLIAIMTMGVGTLYILWYVAKKTSDI